MSYAVSAALQAALYQRLKSDVVLAEHVGQAIFDAVPAGPVPPIYVTLGGETVRDRSDKSGNGAAHDLGISIISAAQGFQQAKEAAAAISDALLNAELSLSRGRLIALWFLRATAKRNPDDGIRRIDMIFRARVEDS